MAGDGRLSAAPSRTQLFWLIDAFCHCNFYTVTQIVAAYHALPMVTADTVSTGRTLSLAARRLQKLFSPLKPTEREK